MSLKHLLFGAGVILGLSGPLQTQTPLTIQTNPTNATYQNGIPQPKGEPQITFAVRVQKETSRGHGISMKIGTIELRENSLYANLFLDHYQIMFEQCNDSVFKEHLYTKSVLKSDKRYEIFTVIQRNDSLFNESYETIIGTPRPKKEAVVNKSNAQPYQPTFMVAKDFFVGQYTGEIAQEVNMILLSLPYTFIIREERNKNNITTYANLNEIIKEQDDKIILDQYIHLFSNLKEGKRIPNKFETKFIVTNIPTLNGTYKATGTSEK